VNLRHGCGQGWHGMDWGGTHGAEVVLDQLQLLRGRQVVAVAAHAHTQRPPARPHAR
jgi:hypothetical protein